METKKTPVEWLVDELPIRIINSYQEEIRKAKKMEKDVPEISDEDIEKAAMDYDPRMKLDVEFIRSAFRAGARWMKEKLNP